MMVVVGLKRDTHLGEEVDGNVLGPFSDAVLGDDEVIEAVANGFHGRCRSDLKRF